MPQVLIRAILWRKINNATVDTLAGTSRGQYDIRLNKHELYEDFFHGLPQTNSNGNGGFDINLPFEAVGGNQPIAAHSVTLRYMGGNSARQDWYIASQRPTTAYEAWRLTVAVPGLTGPSIVNAEHYIVLVKDSNNKFHARWIDANDFSLLSPAIKDAMKKEDHGVLFLDGVTVSPMADKLFAQLMKHHNILLYGPPGTGKSHLLQEVIQLFTTKGNYLLYTDKLHDAIEYKTYNSRNAAYNWVTFHQSYSYEEFIISLKPNPASKQLLSLEPVAGTLLELAEFARIKGNSSLLVVDEINRGNVSRIFGEFITLLEPDKRLNSNCSEHFGTVKLRLPYINGSTQLSINVQGAGAQVVPNPYTLPYHIFLMATMNSVDRSTTPIDAALRRRFHIVKIEPDLESLAASMGISMSNVNAVSSYPLPLQTEADVKEISIRLLDYLNKNISQFLGQDYQFGHWYLKGLCSIFNSLEEIKTAFCDIWKNQLFPQLEEYFIGRTDQLITILKLDTVNLAVVPVQVIFPREVLQELGAAPILKTVEADNDSILEYINFLISANA